MQRKLAERDPRGNRKTGADCGKKAVGYNCSVIMRGYAHRYREQNINCRKGQKRQGCGQKPQKAAERNGYALAAAKAVKAGENMPEHGGNQHGCQINIHIAAGHIKVKKNRQKSLYQVAEQRQRSAKHTAVNKRV